MKYDTSIIRDTIYRIQGDNGIADMGTAERISKTKKTVANWRNGATKPNVDDIAELCDTFGLTINDFFKEVNE